MSDLAITLQGYPEKVQQLADALEDAFPGLIIWVQSLDETDGAVIKIEGFEHPAMPLRLPRPLAA